MAKSTKLVFSGNEEDCAFFSDQFEAKMYVLKLDKVLLDKVEIKAATSAHQGELDRVVKEKQDLKDQRYRVWCELIQCLQRDAGMMIRCNKGDGTKAWKALNDRYKSGERPRIQQLLRDLTNLKLGSGKTVTH